MSFSQIGIKECDDMSSRVKYLMLTRSSFSQLIHQKHYIPENQIKAIFEFYQGEVMKPLIENKIHLLK